MHNFFELCTAFLSYAQSYAQDVCSVINVLQFLCYVWDKNVIVSLIFTHLKLTYRLLRECVKLKYCPMHNYYGDKIASNLGYSVLLTF